MKNADFDAWLAALFLRRVQSMGVLSESDSWEDIAQLRKHAGVIDKYSRWWDECMQTFVAQGYLELDRGRVRVSSIKPKHWVEMPERGLGEQIKQIKESLNLDQWSAALALVEPCLENLPDVLRGDMPFTDILFADSGMGKAENLYQRNEQLDYFNTIVAKVVKAYVQGHSAVEGSKSIRIIEMGAGTGGTTAMVLPAIAPLAGSIGEYCFTDLSKVFLQYGEDQFKSKYPFFRSALWNIDKPLRTQGIEPGAYDIAIATNVIHATKDIRQTLRKAKSALKPNGILIINEFVEKTTVAILIFGLIDGWGLIEDQEIRIPGSPLLERSRWAALLEEEGFATVLIPEVPIDGKPQQVFVAQSDGFVRREISSNTLADNDPNKRSFDNRINGNRLALPAGTSRPSAQEGKPSVLASEQSVDRLDRFVRNVVVDALSEGLRAPKSSIENDVPFADYGVDSILGVAFVDKIKSALEIELNTAIIFDYTSVDQLVGYILRTHKDQIQAALQRTAADLDAPEREVPSAKKAVTKFTRRGRFSVARAEARVSQTRRQSQDLESKDIAVIGMSGQFPGAKDVNEFWQNLSQGVDCVGEFPAEYLDQAKYFSPGAVVEGKTYCKWGGILSERDCFDSLFFNISPREAESMNPNQRLVLQESWKSLEDAGYNPKTFDNCRVGVFIGAEPTSYESGSYTGSSYGIIASRLSYFLNLKGPAYVVSTGCSSSAVAIHLACESLRRQECSLVLAGGVFAMLEGRELVIMSAVGMLSTGGRCRTFDAACDGTAISEGVGVVVLKRLKDAVADGDSIYGVIKASGANQDGASNGITAPSGLAQEQLITQVYRDYHINPEDIGYVEAHGTGTPLGDPIEANALARAFKQFTSKKSFCVLGSVKANIGHTAPTAGVAGLIKVLLCMKHGQLPGLVHFKDLNPLIELEGSAFTINAKTTAWQPEKGKARVAALNSFGHSGTNVHLVIAEHLDERSGRDRRVEVNRPALVPLSAKSEDRLLAYGKSLLLYLEDAAIASMDEGTFLRNLAYTLQVGREAMSERVVFLVNTVDELRRALSSFCQGREAQSTWKSRIADKSAALAALGDDIQSLISQWFANGKLEKLAELWVNKGGDFDWRRLYSDAVPQRIHLPTYPFANERHWKKSAKAVDEARAPSVSQLHPLVQQNISSAFEARFSSCFSGDEFFLTDHRVQGKKVLPCAGQLEMARVATTQAFGLPLTADSRRVELKNIVWLRPVVMTGDHLSIHISVVPTSESEAEVDIFGIDANGEETLYCQCRGRLLDDAHPALVDLVHLQAACAERSFNREEIYQALASVGLQYGPGHQAITALRTGVDQALATLQMPSTPGEFGLHPGLLDSALQAAIGLSIADNAAGASTPLLAALSSITLYQYLPEHAYAWVRRSEKNRPGDAVQKLDITVCDERGVVCVRMDGLAISTGTSDTAKASSAVSGFSIEPQVSEKEEASQQLLFQEHWEEQEYENVESRRDNTRLLIFADPQHGEQLSQASVEPLSDAVIVTEGDRYEELTPSSYRARFDNAADVETLLGAASREDHRPITLIYTWSKGRGEEGVQALFSLFKAIKAKGRLVTHVSLVGHYDPSCLNTCWDYSWIGLQRSVQLLLPNVRVTALYTDSSSFTIPQLVNESQSGGVTWYRDNRRLVLSIKPLDLVNEMSDAVIKPQGGYLITGGAGGLGLKFAHYLASTYQAKLLLVGRSPLSTQLEAQLDALRRAGAKEAHYHAVDIGDREALSDWARKLPFSLSGVIHAAGVSSPQLFFERSAADISQVLRPKAIGTVLIDEVLGRQPLDFVCYFSSASALLGDFGSCDYAVANRFQMGYAEHRHQTRLHNGRSFVINWPFWRSGGMNFGDAEQAEFYLKSSGQQALETEAGIGLWRDIVQANQRQALVMIGKPSRVERVLQLKYRAAQQSQAAAAQPTSAAPGKGWKPQYYDYSLKQCVVSDLRQQISAILKIPISKLDDATNLTDYGFDSVILTEFAKQLTEHFLFEITPALFFNAGTIERLADHLCQEHSTQMEAFYRRPQTLVGGASSMAVGEVAEIARASRRRFERRTANSMPLSRERESIAIIGMSGRFPNASTVDQLWTLLAEGRSGIREIPLSRWDWREYFIAPGDPANRINTNQGGFIDGVDEFDPLFFEVSPREAEEMDPGERLLLMESYKAIEDAGISPSSLKGGKIGVFVGMEEGQYDSIAGKKSVTTSGNAMISSRLSYFLDLHGPTLAINTACSSGLVAMHQAVMSLRQGECQAALVAGLSLTLSPEFYVLMSEAGMLSADGRCASFAKQANGIGAGEAVVVLMLKRLSDAIADGDRIYGAIKASGINFDGKTNGVTAPNGKMQADLIESIYRQHDIDINNISHIVSHGTGTKLGDPVEINALNTAFNRLGAEEGSATRRTAYCAVTSCKSNLGHTMAASGLVSVVTLLKGMQHRKIPASLHCEDESDYIAWRDSPFYINKSAREWTEEPRKRRMGGVSAFGRSGTNVHAVIEEYSPPEGSQRAEHVDAEKTSVIIPLSAKTKEQLLQRARDLLAFIHEPNDESESGLDLVAIAYTLQVGREAMEERLGFIVNSIEQLKERLAAYAEGKQEIEGVYSGQVKSHKDILSLFDQDSDIQQTVDKWIAHKKLSKLASLWSKGFVFDWNKLYGDRKPGRMSLPTYPFAKERYWIASNRGSSLVGTAAASTPGIEQPRAAVTRTERFLRKGWEVSPQRSAEAASGGALIVCSSETRTLAEQLLQRLPASQIVALDSGSGTTPDWASYTGWIDVVGCGVSVEHDTKWMALLQRYIEDGPARDIRMLCVTQGLEAFQNTSLNLSGADRVGLYRMLSSEYARIRASHVDLDSGSDIRTLVEEIVSEFAKPKATVDEVEICYRQGRRYRAILEETLSTADRSRARADFDFRNGRVLWITGGTRGIGYACAQHFIRHYGVKKLVLTGREELPPRPLWTSAQNEGSAIAKKIGAILALEAQGAQVQVLSVDLTDAAALHASIEHVKATLGPIGGVLHCAGIIDAETPAFVRKSLRSIDAVLAPKVAALDNLQRCFANEALQFFLLFSSVSATVPRLAVGQSDYAQANSYMDYVASAHSGQLPIMSIQWPSWKETGMGESRSPIYQRLGFFSHTTEEGLRLLDQLLLHRREAGPVVVPAIVNTQYWRPAHLLEVRPQAVSPAAPTPSSNRDGSAEKTRAIRTPQAVTRHPLQAIQAWLAELVGRELKLQPSRIDISTPLPDYGADSIMFAQILREISKEVGATLEPSLLFEYPTLEALSKWIGSHYGEVLEGKLGEVHGSNAIADRHAMPEAESSSTRVQLSPMQQHATASLVDIAVVGLSCRFPGASTVEDFWQLLSEGRSAIARVPKERWGYSTNDYAGVLDGADCFDPEFFSISQADARAMDPQALLVLEQTLALWYQAGYTIEEIRGREIGVYLGARSQPTADAAALNEAQNLIMAIGANYLSANISRFFDLRGPSIVIDTACSSALVAMNTAIQALHGGEIESALVGGVSLLNSDLALRTFERRRILNRDSEFHLFDRRASGAILGEGAGMVWLKTVDRALRDGDAIYGVIKAVAINNDGRTAGPAAPNIQAQKAVMTRALEKCGKQAAEVSYVEVNGSGTEVVDLLELKAIESVYRSTSRNPCELGSMKPNIGHPLCAEGIGSFIKAILMLHHRRRVPFLSAREPLQHYDLASSPFYFSRALSEPGEGHSTIAINSFADGGTNAHVILDAWEEARSPADLRRPIEMPPLRKIKCNALSPARRVALAVADADDRVRVGTGNDNSEHVSGASQAHPFDESGGKVVPADFWGLDGCNESANSNVVDVDFWGLDRELARQVDA